MVVESTGEGNAENMLVWLIATVGGGEEGGVVPHRARWRLESPRNTLPMSAMTVIKRVGWKP